METNMNINTNLETGFIEGSKPANHSIARSVIKNLMKHLVNPSEKKVDEVASEYLNMDNNASGPKTPVEIMATKIDRSKITEVRPPIPSNAYPELLGEIDPSLTEPLLFREGFYRFKQVSISK